MPPRKYVGFDEDQGRRIARTVLSVEQQVRDGMGESSVEVSPRRIPNVLFAVKCTKDGGSAGSASTTCSWTYTVTTLSGRELGTTLSPTKYRVPDTEYIELPADSIGSAYFDETGTLTLWDAGEFPAIENCVTEEA